MLMRVSSPVQLLVLCQCLLLLLLLSHLQPSLSSCPSDCNRHGSCTDASTCKCFSGWEGNDCGRRSCPLGASLSSVPYADDEAHTLTSCSGQGRCDYSTGLCKCYAGFDGHNCARTSCLNGCSGNGQCISLRMAAEDNDGYRLNRTTKYDRWDGDRFYGCKCDYGFTGLDCSQKACEYGPDPRMSETTHESIKLICACNDGNCNGRFKFRFFGVPIRTWLDRYSTMDDMVEAIMTAPGIYKNTKAFSLPPVYVVGRLSNATICTGYNTTQSVIMFRRNAGDLPPLAFYANEIPKNVYLQTEQILRCNCADYACNGTYRLSFDGEMSSKINSWSNGTSIIRAINSMNTVKASGYTVVVNSHNVPLCVKGNVHNITIIFKGNSANAPRLGIWSSVVYNHNPLYYATTNTSGVLSITTNDGRDDHLKICNGVGRCDLSTGLCSCPYGWGPDADLGACGGVATNTSQWPGVARCPGVIVYNTMGSVGMKTNDDQANFKPRFYVSFDPYNDIDTENSTIWSYLWRAETIRGAKLDVTDYKRFLNLTSSKSAGPIALDQAKDQIIFVDANRLDSFIGLAPQYGRNLNYTRFVSYSGYQIFGLAFDAHFARRKLFWTAPGFHESADGEIYYAYIDAISPTVYTLSSVIGQNYVVSPFGIAVHHIQKRIYWTDRNLTAKHSVLRSCKYDGSDYQQFFMFKRTRNVTVSVNLTDLVIHFSNNNTALMIDAKSPASIVAMNLDFPITYSNITGKTISNENYFEIRYITRNSEKAMESPRYLVVDDWSYLVMWSDYGGKKISYDRYRTLADDLYSPGTAFTTRDGHIYYPVGMLIDRGLGRPRWSNYLECYGNGLCQGLEGKWSCACYEGFYGDCQSRSCPKGRAWYMEPAVDNIAHDEYVECSNMGVCDVGTGLCKCNPGFEGSACERLSCPSGPNDICFGRGRCLSMRQLAEYHRDKYLDPAPVQYGVNAKDPKTWDADMIFGCLPDEYGSYYGEYNVSHPSGRYMDTYDCPMTYNTRLADRFANHSLLHEIQEITCDADEGYFKLSFRGVESDWISTNSTAKDFKKALQMVPSIGQVDVSLSHYYLCSGSGAYTANVTFRSRVGFLPLIKLADKSLSGGESNVYIKSLQKSRGDDIMVCAGHGDCDTITGKCKCYDQYGSSDGFGKAGTTGDCGYNVYSD